MKKKWTLIGIGIVVLAFIGYWIDGKVNPGCETCQQRQLPFFQLFSAPSSDAAAREKKFQSFIDQSYSLFRVAVTPEEAAYPDVQAILQKFPHKFAKLPDGYRSQELFYRWIHSVPPTDIIVLFPADQGLNQTALARLQALYSAAAAWLAFQGDIKHWAQNGVLTGYASLFQKIKLQDFLEHGTFSENCAPENRLFELAGRHVRRLRGNFVEGKSFGYSWIARSRKSYPRFRPGQKAPAPESDLVIFSFDRPMHLFALLESVEQFVSSVNQISVIYRVSSSPYEEGYELVKKKFPHVRYLKQGEAPEQDFKPLVLKATFQSPSSYVMFAIDHMIVRDNMDIQEGIMQMEKTGALGVYYRLGRHVNFSYRKNQSIPPSIFLENDLWAWQFSGGEGEWKYPYTVDMTLYRKNDIKRFLNTLKYDHPHSMERGWALKAKNSGIGIYYDTSKVVNIPLNMIGNDDIPQYTAEQLLTMFLAGLKLDIKPLQGYLNRSAYLDIPVSFIRRDETKN